MPQATIENDVMRQIQAFFSMKGLPASSCPDSHPPTTETAIFVKSHVKSDCSHLQEARYKLVTCTTSLLYKIQGCEAGGPPPAARQRGMHFAFGLGSFKNCTTGKWPRNLILKLPNFGTLGGGVSAFQVYNLLEQSLSRIQI